MTFSICAYDRATGQVGVGALTAMMGVGKLVSHAEPRVGAAATQAPINPYLAIDSLELVASGQTAQDAVETVIGRDDGRAFRQVGLVGRDGSTAAWTGSELEGWAGHLASDDVIAQGNRLVGPETLEATLDGFSAKPDLDLAHPLLYALEAGEATGADRLGERSGAILVMETEEYPVWDVRVDLSDDPAASLRELFHQFEEEILPQIRKMSTRDDYVGQMTREQIAS